MPHGTIDPRYGNASATPPDWLRLEQLLAEAPLYWIVTVRADGRPHAVPLVGVWHDGSFAFCTGPEEQKQRNLEAGPAVCVTAGSSGVHGWDSGLDVVVEGTAVRVTDPADLQALADAWLAKYGEAWHFAVHGDTFVQLGPDGAADGHGGLVHRVTAAKVIAFGGDHGQTTFRF